MQGAGEVEEQDHQLHSKQYGKVYFLLDWPLGFSGLASVHECLFRKVCFESGKGDAKFQVLKRFIEASKVPLQLRKGVYPYDYMAHMSKFQERQLPPKEATLPKSISAMKITSMQKQCLQGFTCKLLASATISIFSPTYYFCLVSLKTFEASLWIRPHSLLHLSWSGFVRLP